MQFLIWSASAVLGPRERRTKGTGGNQNDHLASGCPGRHPAGGPSSEAEGASVAPAKLPRGAAWLPSRDGRPAAVARWTTRATKSWCKCGVDDESHEELVRVLERGALAVVRQVLEHLFSDIV